MDLSELTDVALEFGLDAGSELFLLSFDELLPLEFFDVSDVVDIVRSDKLDSVSKTVQVPQLVVSLRRMQTLHSNGVQLIPKKDLRSQG